MSNFERLSTEDLEDRLMSSEHEPVKNIIAIQAELGRRAFEGVVDMPVYDAIDDTPTPQEHPEDDRWIIRGED